MLRHGANSCLAADRRDSLAGVFLAMAQYVTAHGVIIRGLRFQLSNTLLDKLPTRRKGEGGLVCRVFRS